MKNLSILFFLNLFAHTYIIGQVTLISSDIDIEIGDTIDAVIQVKGFKDMTSFQLSVGWDAESLEYIETGNYFSSDLSGSFNQTKTQEGKIGALWLDSTGDGVSVPDSTILFNIKFLGLADSDEGAKIAFINDPLDIEFTDTSLVPLPDTLLSFEEGSMMVGDVVSVSPSINTESYFQLYQNIPNPFTSRTRLVFELYKRENVFLDVYDALGRNIYTINTYFSAGRNNFVLPRGIFPKAGIYYYTLKTDLHQVSSSVLLLE